MTSPNKNNTPSDNAASGASVSCAMRCAMRFIAAFAGDLFVFAFAVVAVWASFDTKSSEAYYFPRLVSVLLLFFAIANLAKILSWRTAMSWRTSLPPSPLSAALGRRLLPGALIAAAYIYSCDLIGFYLSAALAFVALSIAYNAVPFDKRQWIMLTIATALVIGGVYFLFNIVLKVQTPEPFWID